MSETIVEGTLPVDPVTETKPRSCCCGGASKGAKIAGWIIGGLPTVFMLLGGVFSAVAPGANVENMKLAGYGEHVIVPLGIVLTISCVLYLLPRTATLGAILLTGYLGGAVATHVQLNDPFFAGILFPVYFGIAIWLGLLLRDPAVRAVLPVKCTSTCRAPR